MGAFGFLINTEEDARRAQPGSLAWAGLGNTYFWTTTAPGLPLTDSGIALKIPVGPNVVEGRVQVGTLPGLGRPRLPDRPARPTSTAPASISATGPTTPTTPSGSSSSSAPPWRRSAPSASAPT